MYQNTPKTSVFCTEKWMNFLNGMFLFQLVLFSRKFWNIMVGNLTSGLLINIDFSKRFLNEACGVLLLVCRFQDRLYFQVCCEHVFINCVTRPHDNRSN